MPYKDFSKQELIDLAKEQDTEIAKLMTELMFIKAVLRKMKENEKIKEVIIEAYIVKDPEMLDYLMNDIEDNEYLEAKRIFNYGMTH